MRSIGHFENIALAANPTGGFDEAAPSCWYPDKNMVAAWNPVTERLVYSLVRANQWTDVDGVWSGTPGAVFAYEEVVAVGTDLMLSWGVTPGPWVELWTRGPAYTNLALTLWAVPRA